MERNTDKNNELSTTFIILISIVVLYILYIIITWLINIYDENKKKRCPKCNKKINENWDFCNYCGYKLEKEIKNIEITTIKKNKKYDRNICPKCGNRLKLKNGKYGEFIGCSNYPYCKYTRHIKKR